MIIHAYLTNGFFPWAKLFLKSYKHSNGDKNKVILSTRGLSNKQVKALYSCYDNLDVQNTTFNIRRLAKKANISIETLLKYKREVETNHVTMENKIWKLMIAADDRVKSVLDVLKDNKNEDFILHFDIDMYIRKPLDELEEFIKKHDISIRLRLKSKPSRKTLISVQGYRVCDLSENFLKTWLKYVEDVPPRNRPLGYGQTSCWYAYKDFKDKVKWGDISRKFAAPQMYDRDVIWSANTPKGKTRNLQLFYEDFNKLRGLKNEKNR